MARDKALENNLITCLLDLHSQYNMEDYNLILPKDDAHILDKAVKTTVGYLRDLSKKEYYELITSIEPANLTYLSCVLCKSLARSYKV